MLHFCYIFIVSFKIGITLGIVTPVIQLIQDGLLKHNTNNNIMTIASNPIVIITQGIMSLNNMNAHIAKHNNKNIPTASNINMTVVIFIKRNIGQFVRSNVEFGTLSNGDVIFPKFSN